MSKPFSKEKATCEILQRLCLSKRIKFSETKSFVTRFCMTLTHNQKVYHCVIHLKDHPFVQSEGPKCKQSMKFTRKSVDFRFAVFLGFLVLIPVTHKQQGNNGGKGSQFPRCRITAGGAEWLRGAKRPNNVTSIFSSTVDLLLKDLRFEHCFLPFPPSNLSPCVEIKCGVRGTCFYFQMTKTNGIHKLRFLQICLSVRHVVSR